MVKLALDTNRDGIEDLEEALAILQEAITRRKATEAIAHGGASAAKKPSAQELVEETAVDTPFLKITVQSDEEQGSSSPTLNQLLSSESITEEELEEMFKGEGTSVAPEEKKEKKSGKDEASEDAFIEIVEFDDDRQ